MKVRRIVFWMHRCAALFVGTVVFIMSITGVTLAYQRQLTEWADRSYWPSPTAGVSEPLSVDALIAKVREARPDANPSAVILYSDPSKPAAVTIAQGRHVF